MRGTVDLHIPAPSVAPSHRADPPLGKSVPMSLKRRSFAAAALAFTLCAFDAAAQGAPETWRDVKCARYKAASAEAVKRLTTRGLSRDFLNDHDAFLASNCTATVAVCPRSEEELRLANALVVMSMNDGMASTFAPFSCRK